MTTSVVALGLALAGGTELVGATLAPRVTLKSLAAAPIGGPLRIESSPPGAAIFLDGRTLGPAPVSIPSITAGTYRLRLMAENYFDWDGDLVVPAGTPVVRSVVLPPRPAEIAVNSTVKGTGVWIDGRDIGEAPLSHETEPGNRTIRVEADGFNGWEEQLTVQPNEQRTLYFVASGPNLNLVYGDPSSGVAVMIDNQEDARPQTGLNDADVVYEALVEGGITRYLALFLTRSSDVVGPVRSARHYFVNWANEYRAPLMHIGASPQGYDALAATGLANVDGRAFYRTTRPAPHNAYTSTALVQSSLRIRPSGTFGGLRFGEPERTEREAVRLQFKYGASNYRVEWALNTSTGLYARSVNGKAVLDAASGEAVTATNILVMWMNSSLIPDDDAGRLDFRQTGNGQLLSITAGFATDAQWSRSSLRAVSEYRDKQGRALVLAPGNTWIQVVPVGTRVDLFGDDADPDRGTN